jgi:hypothetical protein
MTASGATIRVNPRFALFWLLAAAALLLRAGLPAGWMPQASESGIRIALCTGDGAVMATLGDDGKVHKDAPAPQAPHDPCPFGLALAAADVPVAPLFAILPPAPVAAPPMALAEAEKRIRRSIRPPARGPPAFV